MHLLTRKEAAKILRLAPHTLAVWAMTGKNLKVVKFGKSVRYREEDINEYIQNNLQPASTPKDETASLHGV
jgi:predicted site-specific integrase-resolvase